MEKKSHKNDAAAVSVIISEKSIRDKIYVIRGMQVMLDSDLAEIYGYTTKAFNQQMRRNKERFPDDFYFQLTLEEAGILRSQFVTANISPKSRTLPSVFTEAGIYMLMTVLKGDLAIQQSIALIRTFQSMKYYIVENNSLIYQHDLLQLSDRIHNTQNEVSNLHKEVEEQLNAVFHQLDNTVRKSEISPVLLDFSKPAEQKEYLFLNGQPFTADQAYQHIYSLTGSSIHIIDDYINIKTLHHLQEVDPKISVTILNDNVSHHLHKSDYDGFLVEFPGRKITFLKTNRMVHDRYIILDYGTDKERVFLCGSSSKDAGTRMTTIAECTEELMKNALNGAIETLLQNPEMDWKR